MKLKEAEIQPARASFSKAPGASLELRVVHAPLLWYQIATCIIL